MSVMIGTGDSITVDMGGGRQVTASVGAEIGCGGQGCVFEVTIPGGGPAGQVIKWYKEPYATIFHDEQLQAIVDLVEVGPPSDCYLWPWALARSPLHGSFGYVMNRLPGGFAELRRVLQDEQLPYDSMFAFAIRIAASLQELHTRGLVYRDINLDNFFVRPDDGAALICDTDNIGYEKREYMGVLGKDDFMAPEIVCNTSGPNANTDRHSLAVLLFMLLMRWHPIEGCNTEGLMDDTARLRHFGQQPRFCLHPHDTSNRPPAGADHVQHYWNWIPLRIQRLFTRAFTTGLDDPQHGRVMESEWLDALVALRDSQMTCPACGNLGFHDPEQPGRCRRPGCGGTCDDPAELDVQLGTGRTRQLVLRPGARLFGYHLKYGYQDPDPVAEIVGHPEQPGELGLVNLGADNWQIRFADGERGTAGTGDAVALEPGVMIRAGNAQISLKGRVR